MSDITTIEEVQAGDYTVRVGQADDGTAWEAVVLSKSGGSADPTSFSRLVLGMPPSGSSDGDDEGPIGPPVTAPHRWVAIGFAIEAYEWRQVNESPVDVEDAYRMIGTDINFNDEVSIRGNATAFAESFDLNPDSDDE